MSFDSLGLRAELLRAVRAQGYAEATPIQAQAIPAILEGRDVLGGAQTGAGKSAAFILPMLQRLSQEAPKSRSPRALILTPTRELCAQVAQSVLDYGRNLRLRSAAVYGGVGIRPQIERLRRGVDILVATPGRLLDHAGQGTVDLSRVEILTLDEADRMLDMGFLPDIRRVLDLLPQERQNMLFSATYSKEIKRLASGLLRHPAMIEVAPANATADSVSQVVHPVARSRKRALLSHLIREGDWRQALVFTRTKHGANQLAQHLEKEGVSATAIHGNKSQAARTRALADFKRGAVRILVATDLASRGLDISLLPYVVNYELPTVPEDYIHRIGRTGRMGASGIALSMVCIDERDLLTNIEKLLDREIEVRKIPGFEPETSPSPPPAPRRFQSRSAPAGRGPGFDRRVSRSRVNANGNRRASR